MNVAAGTASSRLQHGIDEFAAWLTHVDDGELGNGLIGLREGITRMEAVFAEGLRRFDGAGEYRADGALSSIAWLKWKCKLSGGAAAERVGIARQIEKLPQTQQAFSNGSVGYQQVAMLVRTAENVGTAPIREHEAALLQAARTMDAGQFAAATKDFEQRVDAESVLAEANRAYGRRYLHLSEPGNGLVRLDGLLDAEGGAIVRTALGAVTSRDKDDERTAGQRTHDALIDLCKRSLDGGTLPERGGQRPHLIITTTVDNLAGLPGQPSGQLMGTAGVPAEAIRRQACDSAVSRITNRAQHAELEAEVSHASRTIPPAIRRAIVVRDRGCVFPGCGRPPEWTDGHHLRHWIDGGPTTVENLALLCRRHHRMVHEGGWQLVRRSDERFDAVPVSRLVEARARSA